MSGEEGRDLPPTTVGAVSPAVRSACSRFTALLRSGVDPDVRVSPEWTVRDVARHLAGTLPVYVEMAKGSPSPVRSLRDVAEFNATTVSQHSESDLGRLADEIDGQVVVFLEAAASCEADVGLPWHAGVVLPVYTFVGVWVAELLIHGFDVARATRQPWEIPAGEAVEAFRALLPIFPPIVDTAAAEGFSAVYEIRLRQVEDGRWLLAFDQGTLTVHRFDGRRVDCVVSADPVAYLLSAYGRLSPAKAALTGRVVARGRRPWLGLRLNKLLIAF